MTHGAPSSSAPTPDAHRFQIISSSHLALSDAAFVTWRQCRRTIHRVPPFASSLITAAHTSHHSRHQRKQARPISGTPTFDSLSSNEYLDESLKSAFARERAKQTKSTAYPKVLTKSRRHPLPTTSYTDRPHGHHSRAPHTDTPLSLNAQPEDTVANAHHFALTLSTIEAL
jgi:hypothetical protein